MNPTGKRWNSLPTFLLLAWACAPGARADSASWTGDSDAQWSNVANWAGPPAAVPGSGNTATFNGAGNGNTVIDLGAGVTLLSLVFDTASAAPYTVGSGGPGAQSVALNAGATVTVSGTVTNDQTVAAAVTLSGGTTVTVSPAAAGRLTLAGPVSGSGSLT